MSKKEVLAKKYADSIAQFEERKTYCREDFIAGWDAAIKNQWISVEERLPDLNQRVLVAYINITQISVCLMRRLPFDRSNPNNKNWFWSLENRKGRVLAWMPIPSFDEILEQSKDALKRLKDK